MSATRQRASIDKFMSLIKFRDGVSDVLAGNFRCATIDESENLHRLIKQIDARANEAASRITEKDLGVLDPEYGARVRELRDAIIRRCTPSVLVWTPESGVPFGPEIFGFSEPTDET